MQVVSAVQPKVKMPVSPQFAIGNTVTEGKHNSNLEGIELVAS